MTIFKKTTHPTPPVTPTTQTTTTGPQDIRLLADAILAVIQTSEYDDMPWAEIDAALMLASHDTKIVFQNRGTLDPPDVLMDRRLTAERNFAVKVPVAHS